ncbi:nucleotidyltransferase family protein [Alteromonas sp. ZYF713]|nr:nucleotidyltransferase family protein [Alteromonas sp. ZYF713]
MNTIEIMLGQDKSRMQLLQTVQALQLPDCYIAAGFVRNMVWDVLHDYPPTPLNDVDVIYYDKQPHLASEDIENKLTNALPDVNWQVKNQAVMHHRNHDPAYQNSTDAMRYWPEKETAVGVRLNDNNQLELAAPFGVNSLLEGKLTHNPLRSKAVFEQRIASKQWLKKWPKLQVIS